MESIIYNLNEEGILIPIMIMELVLILLALFSIKRIIEEIRDMTGTVKVKAKVADIVECGTHYYSDYGWRMQYKEIYSVDWNGENHMIEAALPFIDGDRSIGTELMIRINPNDLSKTVVNGRIIILHIILAVTWILGGLIVLLIFS